MCYVILYATVKFYIVHVHEPNPRLYMSNPNLTWHYGLQLT